MYSVAYILADEQCHDTIKAFEEVLKANIKRNTDGFEFHIISMNRACELTSENAPELLVIGSNSLVSFVEQNPVLSSLPVLFHCYSATIDNLPIPFNQLFGVIRTTDEVKITAWGIPSALVHYVELPTTAKTRNPLIPNKEQSLKTIYFPEKNNHPQCFQQLIEVVNRSPEIELTIHDPNRQYLAFKNCLNSHIKISNQNKINFDEYELVIGTNRNIIDGMARGCLCLVFGNHGLGGLVTPSSYHSLKKYNFTGRPGAAMHEIIPYDLLTGTFRDIINNDYSSFIPELQKRVAADYSADNFVLKIDSVFHKALNISRMMQNASSFAELCPARGDNFTIKKEKSKSYIIRGSVGTLFSGIDRQMLGLIDKCKGRKSMSEIIKLEGYAPDALEIFLENIMELWKKKLVTLHLKGQ